MTQQPDALDRLAALRAMSRAIDADHRMSMERLRQQVRAEHEAGLPISQIARAIGRDRVTIYRWLEQS